MIPPLDPNIIGFDPWVQPDSSSILLDDRFALMDRETFDELTEVDPGKSIPAFWTGKIWKTRYTLNPPRYFLYWITEDLDFDKREIILA